MSKKEGIEVRRIFDLLLPFEKEGRKSSHKVFSWKSEGKWHHLTAEEYVHRVSSLSQGLIQWGLKPGDKVASILRNGPEWNILDMALLQCRGVQVPVYPTISQANFTYIFRDAGVVLAFVSDEETYHRIRQLAPDCPSLRKVILTDRHPEYGWDSLFVDSAEAERELQERKNAIRPEELATLIYTSGTTGKPKGVMLSHHNLVSNFLTISRLLEEAPHYRRRIKKALSFLPLCHVYERIINYFYQYLGIEVFYVSSLEALPTAFAEVKPDMLCAVPRILEKSYARFLLRGRYLKGTARAFFLYALRLASKYEQDGSRGLWYRIRLSLTRMIVLRKWRQAFGGKLKVVVSGGASLNEKLVRIYWAAGIRVMDGYGLTETSPVVAVGTFQKGGVRFGTVGPVIRDVEVKTAPDGEILVRGPNVMLGYLNRPERTAEVIDAEGWFHTGDIGSLDEDGFLRITDRKKEIFKTSGGKYIAPQVLENHFRASDFIENIMVVGEGRNYPAAIVRPNFVYLEGWCKAKGIPWEAPPACLRKKEVISRFQREMSLMNVPLDHTESIKRFALIADSWDVDSGTLSPTLKLRRRELQQQYAGLIEAMYRGSQGQDVLPSPKE